MAVRSSATAEDLADASYAGQQESYLDVHGGSDLLAAVRACWASLWSDRSVAYRRRHGVDEVAMAVVVQRMVDADAAGVLFTADPVTGDDSTIAIEAVAGLGEALVGGEATPDRYLVDRATRAEHAPVGPRAARRPTTLSRTHVRRLVELAERVVALYGAPMDLEWARRGDDLVLLQARPITTEVRPDPWNDSRSGDFLWTNTNVGEAIPDVMTPATWSMVQVFLTDAMATASIPPYVGYGRIGGRIYLNVSVMMSLSAAVGVMEKHFRGLTEEVFGRLPEDLEIPPVRAHRVAILRSVVPMAVHMYAEVRRDAKTMSAYLDAHPRLCTRRRSEIAAVDSPRDLADLWADVLSPEFHHVSLMLSAATRSSGASFVTTRKRLQRLVGDAAANALTAGLGGAAGQLASMGLLEGLDLLARGEIDRSEFAIGYGHRGPHEFEISRPRPGEDPAWIEEQLAAREWPGDGDHRALLARQERERERAWAELERRHPLQAVLLHRQLATWGTISRNRERARSEVIRYFWVLRAYVLRAGELTGLGEDAFFLDKAEIVRVLDGETVGPGLIADRRAAYASYSRLPAYPALIRGRFSPFAWARDGDRRTDLWVEGGTGVAADGVRGFPGSAGVVEGEVRVLRDVADGSSLMPGEVLVTTVTNVGWTPLFPRAAALVTDVGAPLSHAAIVARELGIPAVVGCGNATMRLRTGDRVRVDGTAGTVEVLA